MKLTLLCTGIVLAAIFFAGCQQDGGMNAPPVSEDPDIAAMRMIDAELADSTADSTLHGNRKFKAKLSGKHEVPSNESKGKGVASFKISKDGTEIEYKLIVAKISNVSAAHIHRGGKGVNGPVVFELYAPDTGEGCGRNHGEIAKGRFTPADLVGPYAGSTNFDMFLEDLHLDSLYVNVHTDDGIDSTNGGIGDLPAGEIRGQLKGHKLHWEGDDCKGDGHDKGKGKGHDKGKGHGKGKGHDKGKGKGHDKDGDGHDDHRGGGNRHDDDDDHGG